MKSNPWKKVQCASDCYRRCPACDELICDVCDMHYANCDCYGPTQDDLEYKYRKGVLYARILYDYPRLRDLPKKEQAAFAKELAGQTRPLVPDIPMKDQDFFYQCDYDAWKAKLAGKPITWD